MCDTIDIIHQLEEDRIMLNTELTDLQLAYNNQMLELKKAKRLLKMVVEFRKSDYCTKNCSECVASPCDYIDWFKNMYDNEIEKLIAEKE